MGELFSEDNKVIAILAIGAILLLLMALILILFFYMSKKKITQKELEKIAISLDQQQKVLQASITAQEEERKRIAQDLHDAISAKLNVISLTTHVLLDDPAITDNQRSSLSHILDVTSNTLKSSRKIAHDLMPPVLEKFGLKVALEELFEDFIKSKHIKIYYHIEDIPSLIKSENLHVFRIIQELISNSIKHGNANTLNINIINNKHGFIINYIDNGSGFKPKKSNRQSGIGLQNIESRVAILDGTFLIKSEPGEGSTFIIDCTHNERQDYHSAR